MGGIVTSDTHRVVAPNLDPAGILNEKRSWNKPKANTHKQSLSNTRQSEVTEAAVNTWGVSNLLKECIVKQTFVCVCVYLDLVACCSLKGPVDAQGWCQEQMYQTLGKLAKTAGGRSGNVDVAG